MCLAATIHGRLDRAIQRELLLALILWPRCRVAPSVELGGRAADLGRRAHQGLADRGVLLLGVSLAPALAAAAARRSARGGTDPLLTRPPGQVLSCYQQWGALPGGPAKAGRPRWPGYRDVWTIWENLAPRSGRGSTRP